MTKCLCSLHRKTASTHYDNMAAVSPLFYSKGVGYATLQIIGSFDLQTHTNSEPKFHSQPL